MAVDMREYHSEEDLNKLRMSAKDLYKLEKRAAQELLEIQIANAQKVYDTKLKNATAMLEREKLLEEQFRRKGIEEDKIAKSKEIATNIKKLQEEEKARLAGVSKKDKATREAIKKEYKEKIEKEKNVDKETLALYTKRKKTEEKIQKEQLKTQRKEEAAAYAELRKQGLSKEEAKIKLEELTGASADEADKIATGAAIAKTIKVADKVTNFIGDFAKQLAGTIKEIAYTQTEIDTRLQGSSHDKKGNSYWREISDTIKGNVAVSPFVKQADVVNNLKNLVGQGIAYNVEQRAFLDTISSKIATTFEATDATLLKLVRIQQQDTTAARLGMESALTAFLNNMYETTEYMSQIADSIRANIYEASALMGAADATAFEYQIQKWMGSMYSVGMSDTAVNKIASALGEVAAGKIEGLTGDGAGNLVVMAANQAGLSIADILQDGLNDAETNNLLKAMVEYLGDIYSETKNSRVVSQQFANVYGLSASDLKAAANLARSTTAISNQNLNYGGMITQLNNMANTMYQRTSSGEMMENLFNNFQYTMAEGIANNPILYATYNIASMLDSVAGGISIPAFSVMGNMVDLDTTVADLMRVGALSGSVLGGIGSLISGLARGSGGGFSGSGMLKAFGVSESLSTVSRGTGEGLLTTATAGVSSSGEMVGNADGSDVKTKTMNDAQESGDQQLAEAQEESNETKLSTVDEHIMAIYDLLSDVTAGGSSLHVTIDDNFIWTQSLQTGF